MAALIGQKALGGQPPERLRVFDVTQFGAKGDGFTDDTVSAQAAIDAALKAGGGLIHFPAGRYRITRTLKFSSSERVDVTGDGASSTLLHEHGEHLLEWKSGVSCREVSVRNLCFTSVKTKKPYDAAVIACLGGCERSFFHHLLFNTEGAPMGSGIVVENVMDTTTLDHCLMWGPVRGTGVKVARGSEVRIFGGRLIGASDPYVAVDKENIGIHLVGNNGGVHIVTTDIIGLGTGLKIGEPGGPSNREVFITHATFDSSVHGVVQTDNTFTSIAGCWAASSDEDQILIEESARGAILTIAGGTIFNGGAYGRPGAHNGIVVKAGSFTMSGIAVRHNKGTGILVGDGVQEYAITGCRVTYNGTGAELGGDFYTFTGNVLAHNKTNLVDRGGKNKQITANAMGNPA